MKSFFTFIAILFLFSCSAKKDISMIKNSSVFAKVNELGVSKSDFISKYGNPISKDLIKGGANMIETLYYVEIIDGIIITTKIKFENDQVVEQSNYKMEYSEAKRIKELEYEIQRNRRATLNVN